MCRRPEHIMRFFSVRLPTARERCAGGSVIVLGNGRGRRTRAAISRRSIARALGGVGKFAGNSPGFVLGNGGGERTRAGISRRSIARALGGVGKFAGNSPVFVCPRLSKRVITVTRLPLARLAILVAG